MDRTTTIAALAAALADEPLVVTVWLFGSVARDTHHARSDIDLAILADGIAADRTAPAFDRAAWSWDLADRLTGKLGRTVQVVEFDRAPADLTHRILRDGVVVVDRDRARRIAMEVRKQNEYFDMTPIWQRIRRLSPGVLP